MSSSVQFYGIDSVLTAVENRKCPAWGMFQGRQFLFKYEGEDIKESADTLDQILRVISENNTTATYTLKFYEVENKKAVKIKENTPCDGSFNFRLIDEEERTAIRTSYRNNNPEIVGLVKTMNERMEKLEDYIKNGDDDDDEEPETIQEAIMGAFRDPAKMNEWVDSIQRIKGLLGYGTQPAQVGNVNRVGQTNTGTGDPHQAAGGNMSQPVQTEEWFQRLGNAVDALYAVEPQILEIFEKLAQVAKTNPGKIKSITSMVHLL